MSRRGECGAHELLGERKRYRVLDLERLMSCLGIPPDVSAFRNWYGATLTEMCQTEYLVREPLWTECVAVGGRQWVETLSSRLIAGQRAIRELSQDTPLVAEAEQTYGLYASRRGADASREFDVARTGTVTY